MRPYTSEWTTQTSLPTIEQVSAGGVAFRRTGAGAEVALICVGAERRWQLPKGMVNPGEQPEEAALREVREEAGITARLISPIDRIEYWYIGQSEGRRVRLHKHVHFFLMEYVSGDVNEHDHEVNEARWVEIDEAIGMLTFKGERLVLVEARERTRDLLSDNLGQK